MFNSKLKKYIKCDLEELITGKDVALVGPAYYMQGSNMGADIEGHEVVVRINRGIESTRTHGDDVGTRTDVLYSCLIETAAQAGVLNAGELRDKYGVKAIIAPPHSDINGVSKRRVFHDLVDFDKVEEISKFIPVRLIDSRWHTELAKKVSCKPNTGIVAIYDLLDFKPRRLSIYGFSFYLDGFLPGTKAGIEKEKDVDEAEFANMAFGSKRHVQENMWKYAKETLLGNPIVSLDGTLKTILNLPSFGREVFREAGGGNRV